MLFRTAAEADCRAVYDLICDMEAKQLPYPPFARIYRDVLSNADHEILLCERDGDVIAVLHLRCEEQLHHAGRIAEIMELAVRDGCRSQGCGREMLERACRLAEDRGCSQIEVACNRLREDAHRFYQREGMKNFHSKLSRRLSGPDDGENVLGR